MPKTAMKGTKKPTQHKIGTMNFGILITGFESLGER
jgi:hypothetical protein